MAITVTFRLGRGELELRIIGAGLRNGKLPALVEKQPWDDLDDEDFTALEAFAAAGWRFHPQTDLDWNRAKELNGDAIEPGLLARHPVGGLVILTNRIIARLPTPDVIPPEIGDPSPVPLQPNLYDVRLRVPAFNLLGNISNTLAMFNRTIPGEGAPVAEPLLLYFVVHPGTIYKIAGDPEIQEHWDTIKLEAAWKEAKTRGAGTRVAVIDTGFHINEAELCVTLEDTAFVDSSGKVGLAERLANGNVRYVSEKRVEVAPRMPAVPHGTACAGLVGARLNNDKVHGAVPECELMLVAVEDVTSTLAVANAITICVSGFAKRRGADVISGSIGPAIGVWDYDENLRKAINHAHNDGRGTLGLPVVWASFNFDDVVPSNSLEAHVICVSRAGYNDQRVSSGYGPALDLLAPGSRIAVFDPSIGGGVDEVSGSSCAAPMVAGVAALMLSRNPRLSLADVFRIITQNCDPDMQQPNVHSLQVGYGRLNAFRALEDTPPP
jgi:hypothetical protein